MERGIEEGTGHGTDDGDVWSSPEPSFESEEGEQGEDGSKTKKRTRKRVVRYDG